MTRLRRRTTCPVPGHGTSCVAADEAPNSFARCIEERMALDYEMAADEEESPCLSSG